MKEPEYKNHRDLVLKEYEKGNIVFQNITGLHTIPLKEFIKAPIEDMLYELNRDEAVILTFIDDPKWINDFAVCKVITELKNQLNELKNENSNKDIDKRK